MLFYPIVRLDNISLIRNGTEILHDISLIINNNQHWAITGQNGSGKTSLISIINGYHQPSQGKAEVLGKKFGSSDLRDLRLRIGACSSEIRDMVHKWEKVSDIVLSGRFASIGLYKTPASGDYLRADNLLLRFGLHDRADHRLHEREGRSWPVILK